MLLPRALNSSYEFNRSSNQVTKYYYFGSQRVAMRTLPWPANSCLLIDINGDGTVEIGDSSLVSAQWQQTGPPGWIAHDWNKDGSVNIGEVSKISACWQQEFVSTTTPTWLHSDHLGSASATTNANGNPLLSERYKPYGERRLFANFPSK